jgi:molybdopterin/thiamine biosynthesis adenylyltransferase
MEFSNVHLTRQMDLIPLEVLGEKITIIGAGAIGSWTALALAKMGFSDITVFDFDKVDPENLNSQFYPLLSVGDFKVSSLSAMVESFTGVKIVSQPLRYETGIFSGIVIAAVDSMTVRRTIWENHREKALGCRAIIDPRMGAEQALLYVMNPMNPKDIASYNTTLYSDEDAVHERCTAKATIYTANMLAGLVCKSVKDLLTRPDYLRMAQWNIAQDEFLGFKHKVS